MNITSQPCLIISVAYSRLRAIRYTIPTITTANIPAKPGVAVSVSTGASASVFAGAAAAGAVVPAGEIPIIRSIVACGMNEPPSPRIYMLHMLYGFPHHN
jgi:hypothetical protein